LHQLLRKKLVELIRIVIYTGYQIARLILIEKSNRQ